MLSSKTRMGRAARVCFYGLLGVFLVFSGLVLRFINKSCSYAKAEELQLDLCKQYHKGKIMGSMCSAMCDEHKLGLEFCGNNRARFNRKDVLIMRCDGCGQNGESNRLVMKIQIIPAVWKNVSHVVLSNASSIDEMILRTKQFVTNQIRARVDTNSIFTSENYLQGLLGRNYRNQLNYKSDMLSAYVTLKTVIALTLQSEIITLMLFRKASFMPKLYGFCGPAYYVEYTPPITSLGYILSFNTKSSDLLNMRLHVISWEERAKLAIQFIDVIRNVENLGNKRQLEICDIKPNNFGMNDNSTLTFIDSDDCIFDMRTQGQPCQQDSDCKINYCDIHCDKDTGTCSNRRLNNNLQSACRYIFLGNFGVLGLLRSPPEAVREELEDMLHRCSYPEKYDTNMAASNKIDHTILNKIRNILIKSINASWH